MHTVPLLSLSTWACGSWVFYLKLRDDLAFWWWPVYNVADAAQLLIEFVRVLYHICKMKVKLTKRAG